MSQVLKSPPRSKHDLTAPRELARRLQCLVGQPFKLEPNRHKTRTDGANLRKRVAAILERTILPPPAPEQSYRILPPRAKGVTRLRREWLDTFIVTTGDSYNLQVWNRNPAEPIPQIEYADGTALLASDIRLVLVRVDPEKQHIRCVIVVTPPYVVEHFGRFGKQTVKEQLIIPAHKRAEILGRRPPILFYHDEAARLVSRRRQVSLSHASARDAPEPQTTLPLERIRRWVNEQLIGRPIEVAATKNRGQALELVVARGLGYSDRRHVLLAGGYPDLRQQALEVKIQDGPTVDLGRYSPQFEEDVPACPGFTTHTIRYLIALTDSTTTTCAGAIVCPGKRLAEHFVYVGERSFKCQRSIPMAFFDRFDGQCVFNPRY